MMRRGRRGRDAGDRSHMSFSKKRADIVGGKKEGVGGVFAHPRLRHADWAEVVLEHATQKVLNMSLQDITVGKVTQHHVDRVTTPTDQPVKTA